MAITLRQESATGASTKGDSLTFAELDNNFIDLLQNKIQAIDLNGDSGQTTLGQSLANEKLTIAGGTGITTALTTDSAGEAVLTITQDTADTNTTYTLNAATDGSNANINLAGSDASTDTIQLVAGTGISLSVDSAGAIQIINTVADTDTDTTYTIGAQADGSNVNFNLSGSDASTDTIQFVAGSNITLTTDSAGAIEIAASGAASPDFSEGVIAGTNIDVTSDSAGQVTVALEPVVDGIELKDYKETIYALSYGATITPNVANGNVQEITLTGNVTFGGFTSAEDGQSLTLIIHQDGTGSRTFSEGLDSAGRMLFAGGSSTLSTAGGSTDIMSIVYAGGIYYASLATNFS